MMEMIESGQSVMLWAAMGSGKTATVLHSISNMIYDHLTPQKLLVIAPKFVAETTWVDEIEKWDVPLRIVHMDKDREKLLENIDKYDVVTMSHNLLPWLFSHYTKTTGKKWKWDKPFPFTVVAIDEASKFKNPSGTWFKTMARFRRLGIQIIEMTGTPSPRSLEDLWSQTYLVDGGERLEDGITKFRQAYMQQEGEIYVKGGRSIPRLGPKPGAYDLVMNKLKDISVSIVADDWIKMPDRVDIKVFVDIPCVDLYEKMRSEAVLRLKEGVITAGSEANVVGKLLQIANGSVYDEEGNVHVLHFEKKKALEAIVAEATGPVLVFYPYKHDLPSIGGEVLSTPEQIKRWNRGEIKLLAAHPASAGHGLNLQTGGNVIVWYGLPYDLELYLQANARLIRPGQTEPSVFVHHILARGTRDEHVLKALQKKGARQQDVIDAVRYV
jgi:hypothetical protein